MEKRETVLLRNIFSGKTLRKLMEGEECPFYRDALESFVPGYETLSNAECFTKLYEYLSGEYRDEYYYRNTLLNSFLNNTKTSTALAEQWIGRSKADFILVSRNAVVYEIKTELDNFSRLERQINDYYKAFTRVVVVTAESRSDELERRLDNPAVGITVLTSKGKLRTLRKPQDYVEKLSNRAMFRILRKKEYGNIIREYFGEVPEVSQFHYYRACLSLFEKIPTRQAERMLLRALKNRFSVDAEEYSRIPYALKSLVYFSSFRKRDYGKLERLLTATAGRDLSGRKGSWSY